MAKLRHERICQVNNNHKYSYCPYCSEYASLPSWMMGFCSSNCRNIYNIVQDSKVGYISMDEAYEKLMECDLSEEDQFADYIKEQKPDYVIIFFAGTNTADPEGKYDFFSEK